MDVPIFIKYDLYAKDKLFANPKNPSSLSRKTYRTCYFYHSPTGQVDSHKLKFVLTYGLGGEKSLK